MEKCTSFEARDFGMNSPLTGEVRSDLSPSDLM